jgi:hypothetical protein
MFFVMRPPSATAGQAGNLRIRLVSLTQSRKDAKLKIITYLFNISG